MEQLPIQFTPRIGRCETCDRSGTLNARICRRCEQDYGRRTAELLARARREPTFARACYLKMGSVERVAFLDLVGRITISAEPQTGEVSSRLAPALLRGFGPGLAKCSSRGRGQPAGGLRLVSSGDS